MGEALAAAGFRAVGPLLPGHGTTPEDLYITTGADLLRAAETALLSLRGARRDLPRGLSAGALLAVHLAARSWSHEGLPDFSAIALLGAADRVQRAAAAIFANVFGRLPRCRSSSGGRPRHRAGEADEREKVDESYDATPAGRASCARSRGTPRTSRRASTRLRSSSTASAIPRSAPDSSRKLSRMLGLHAGGGPAFPRSGHMLPLDVESDEVCRAVVTFFQGVA